ncbi:MAG TPA: BTAD domain-containing putative transcriptional regulator, partial [Candidatus Dormibacteraeota bacterium]|nr:BTAD domain-containing putative transcriptional regulator [Candidatus Dormibacteraeota bacterium]
LREFEFAADAAARLDDLRAVAAEHAARAMVQRGAAGAAGAAVQEVGRWVSEHPLREGLVEQLMLAKRDAGDLPGALAAYHRMRRALDAELGVEPSERLRAVAAEIANAGVLGGADRRPRFTLPSTSLIGREDEVAELVDLVRRHTLVTITGFPGVGKTTVAAEVCRRLEAEFEGGAFAIDLALVRDSRGVPDEIARALGLQDQTVRRTAEVLRAYLADRHLLLAFNHGEHLAGPMRDGANERETTPGAHYLITSVVPLGASDEMVFNLGPLSLPASTHAADMNASGAVALLRDRLLMVDSEVAPRAADVDAQFRICHRLDGLPLAIELAAARTSLLSVAEVADLLDHDPGLVTPRLGASDLARRSLDSALASAYSALSSKERKLLVAAATFRGTIDVEMLLEVAGITGARQARQRELVEGLVARALLARSRIGTQQRLRMLQATRTFVVERTRKETAVACRARYVEAFALGCEERVLQLERAGQVAALAWLDNELDNVRAALHGLLGGGQAGRALAIISAAGRFWWARGHLTEGRRWLREALQACPGVSDARAEALRILAYLEWSQGEFPVAERHCLEALEIAQQIGDRRSITRSLYYLGVAQHAVGRIDDARATFRRALSMVRTLPDPALEGLVLDMLARSLTSAGRQSQGRGASEKSLGLLKAAGDAFGVAVCLINLGEACVRDRAIDPARRAYTEALTRFRTLQCVVGEGYALQGLAWVAGAAGDPVAAHRLLVEMRECWDRTGYVPIREDEERTAEILAGAVPAV